MTTALWLAVGALFVGVGINHVRLDLKRGRRAFMSPSPFMWIGLGVATLGRLAPAFYGVSLASAFLGLVVAAIQQRRAK